MKIHYLECPDKYKLFSFYRHHYNQHINKDNTISALDGGFDYHRVIGIGIIKEDEINNLIKDIREQFEWGQNYDKEGNKFEKTKYKLLKDLETDHILGILKFFTENLKEDAILTNEYKRTHLIFIEELLYRNNNKIL